MKLFNLHGCMPGEVMARHSVALLASVLMIEILRQSCRSRTRGEFADKPDACFLEMSMTTVILKRGCGV